MAGWSFFLAMTNKDFGPPVRGFTWKQRFESLPGAMPIFFVVGIIIICIYGGVGTPTEAGSLGAFVILIMALYKGMRWRELKGALLETAKLTVMIFYHHMGCFINMYVFLGLLSYPAHFQIGLPV